MEMSRERRRIAGPIDAYDEQPKQEFVKCVVVGDGAVGKTRLICSFVYDQRGIPLHQLNQGAHHPSVFAIDQYMLDSGIRGRANMVVDGVPVCLRLWDTFGDHEKNRVFAYQDAHVVVLCYSVGMTSSLKSINATWYAEIRKFCPRAPIILVGTQQDRRYTDPLLLKHLSRVTYLKCMMGIENNFDDIVSPETGRQTAREIGSVCYLETSVVTKYGVDDVFENAVRLALICRRRNRAMFSSHLRRIRTPILQVPYLPPQNDSGQVNVPQCELMKALRISMPDQCQTYANVSFMVEGDVFLCQAVSLLVTGTMFASVLTNANVLLALHDTVPHCELSLPDRTMTMHEGVVNGVACQLPRGISSVNTFNMPTEGAAQVVVALEGVSSLEFQRILDFITTSSLDGPEELDSLLAAASFLQIWSLVDTLKMMRGKTAASELPDEEDTKFLVKRRLKTILSAGIYSDVTFHLEKGSLVAHKCVLVAQCQVMAAMFRDQNFKESMRSEVEFQSASRESFQAALEYFYSGSITGVDDPIGTLDLANYLCLPRFVALVEQCIIKEIKTNCDSPELLGNTIDLFIAAELHNAPQLANFCLHFLAINYNELYKHYSLSVKRLHSEALKHIEKHRWPPVWYLKEQDYYSKKHLEQEREKEKHASRRKRQCRCF